ncbi:MAG TPA: hypothetical protein VK864_13785, partial [Longimicrobiales bacterium]|nr:hypothetical protein [Longimicrobiales bacterium]
SADQALGQDSPDWPPASFGVTHFKPFEPGRAIPAPASAGQDAPVTILSCLQLLSTIVIF